jgi:cytoskeleton protein RodZ
MATEALKKFADELKSAREEKGLPLKQISVKTRIDLKFLQAIENADFDIMPDLYMRAFIKEFAQLIDLDTAEILQKFENAKAGREEPIHSIQMPVAEIANEIPEQIIPVETPPADSSAIIEKIKFKLNPNYLYIGGGLILILIFIYLVLLKGTSPEIMQEKSYEQNTSQNKPRYELEKQTQDQPSDAKVQPVANHRPDSLRIRLVLDDRVWVKVVSDGKIIHQQYDQSNSKLNFAASKYFSLSVGNAGAVKVFYNNRPVNNIGRKGEIRNIYISPDTIRYLTITPPSKNEKKSPTAN